MSRLHLGRLVKPRDDRRRNGPVTVIRPDPGAWREALRLADGDRSRLRVQPDASVVVLNSKGGGAGRG